MQKDAQDSIYKVVKDYVPKGVLSNKNRAKTWNYGYNEKYDFVVISKNGQIGDIIKISGLYIGLPLVPKKINARSNRKRRAVLGTHRNIKRPF